MELIRNVEGVPFSVSNAEKLVAELGSPVYRMAIVVRRWGAGLDFSVILFEADALPRRVARAFGPNAEIKHVMLLVDDGHEDPAKAPMRHLLDNPWRHEAVFSENPLRWVEHLPHNAGDGKLGYYANPEHRLAGRVTITKPGRYLRKVFGDMLGDQEIERLAHVWAAEFALRPLIVTQDADVIEEVYENGPNSCMSKDAYCFDGPEHPARVYAGPDLAVAYIGDADGAEGRAVVWPEKKIWARVYGDIGRMTASLLAAGFRPGSASEFLGARIQRIEARYGRFVCPYLDVCGYVEDDGEYLILSNDGIPAQDTNGLTEEGRECDDCGGHIRDDDYIYVERGDRQICESCCSENYFRCELSDAICANDERADTRGHWQVSEEAVRRDDNWFYCEGRERWFNMDEDDYAVFEDGTVYHADEADEHGYFDEADGEWRYGERPDDSEEELEEAA